jgi:hypothetical protein
MLFFEMESSGGVAADGWLVFMATNFERTPGSNGSWGGSEMHVVFFFFFWVE